MFTILVSCKYVVDMLPKYGVLLIKKYGYLYKKKEKKKTNIQNKQKYVESDKGYLQCYTRKCVPHLVNVFTHFNMYIIYSLYFTRSYSQKMGGGGE